MSTKSMKRNMSVNQKVNRMKLEKVVNFMGYKESKPDFHHKQEELQDLTNSYNLIDKDYSKIFSKTNKGKEELSSNKASYKANKNSPRAKELRNEILSIITKSKAPNWDSIILKF